LWQVFYRAIYACPQSKRLWLEAFSLPGLRAVFTPDEMQDLLRLMAAKDTCIRVDTPLNA
jgi:hypothetical protein